jgi:hypothetical protein
MGNISFRYIHYIALDHVSIWVFSSFFLLWVYEMVWLRLLLVENMHRL